MSVQRTIHCEGPDCNVHVSTATPPPYVPISFIETHESNSAGSQVEHHFYGWECVMKYAAAQPIPERIEWDDIAGDGRG